MGQVERGHVGGVRQHRLQLGGEQVDLVLAQGEAGQVGHMDHVGTAQLSGPTASVWPGSSGRLMPPLEEGDR